MLKIKKIEIFFQNIGMNGLSYGKISKMAKKKFCIICILNMKETSFEVWYDIRGNSSVLVMLFLEVTC